MALEEEEVTMKIMFSPNCLWKNSAHAGFTLLELLVVIAITGILAALIFPALAAAKQKVYATDCRIELRTDKTIPPGGSLEIAYRYRLPANAH